MLNFKKVNIIIVFLSFSLGFMLGSYIEVDTTINPIKINQKPIVNLSDNHTKPPKIPDYIKNIFVKEGFSDPIYDESTWNEFLEKIKVQNVHELEKEYSFDFLSNYISGTGKLPPDEFFDRFGYDLTEKNETNRSILIEGVKNLHFNDFQKLIDMGLDLSLANGKKDTANIINYALRSPIQAENKVHLLIKNGCTFENGENYLRDAIKANNEYQISQSTLNQIIENTDPNSTCPPYDISALDYTLRLNGSKKSIDYFLDNGFDFSNIKDPSKILSGACVNKNITAVQYQKLIDIAGGLESFKNQNPPLLSPAIYFNRQDFIKVLLKNNVTINEEVIDSIDYLERSKRYSKEEVDEIRKLFEGKI